MPTKRARKALDDAIDYLNGEEFVGLSAEAEAEMRQVMEGLWKALSLRMGKGADCFGCGRPAKVNPRPLNSTMTKGLTWLYVQHKRHGPKFIHMPDRAGKGLVRTNQHSTLKHWNLIEAHPIHTGYFRISGLGRAFWEGRTKVPSHVYIDHDRCLKVSGEMISINEVGGFDLKKVLAEVEVDDEVLDMLEEFDEDEPDE